MTEQAAKEVKDAMERNVCSIQTIDLDCEPGAPRADNYIEDVIKGTGLPSRDPVSKFFGNYRWDWSDCVDKAGWRKIQPVLKRRITALYRSGVIRYGSW